MNFEEKIPSLVRKFATVWVWILLRGCQKVDYLGNDFLTVADLLQVNGLLITPAACLHVLMDGWCRAATWIFPVITGVK